MRSWNVFRKSAKVLREQVGYRRFLQLADPFLARAVDRIEPNERKESVLVVAPHPDDESIGCGGAIALHGRRGDEVHVVYTTDGSKPHGGGPPSKAQSDARMSEAIAALEALGRPSFGSLGLQDGDAIVSAEAIAELTKTVIARDPDRIYVPWALDRHRDHQAAFQLLSGAIANLRLPQGASVWQYEVWTPLVPNRYVPIKDVIKQKEEAIRAHQSQIAHTNYINSSLGLAYYRGVQGALDGPAEAFFAVPAEKLVLFNEL